MIDTLSSATDMAGVATRSTPGSAADCPSGTSGESGSGVVAELLGLVDRLGGLPRAGDDAERVDRIAALERLRGVVAAAQARESVEFRASQLAGQMAAGVPVSRRGRGIAEQIGLARRLSPTTAARDLGFAGSLLIDLPAVYALLRAGIISEWVAKLVVKQTRDLPREVRQRIAEELADDLPSMSPRQAEAAAKRLAYEADPQAVMGRARTARKDRHVSIRPAPDTMTWLTGFLPVEQGVAAWKALTEHADTLRAAGDPRTRGQIMADTMVERVTGQATADAVSVDIGLTITLDTLLALLTNPNPGACDNEACDHDCDPDCDPDSHDGHGGPDGHAENAENAEKAEREPATGHDCATGHDGGSSGPSGFGGGLVPAYLEGHGPIPAELAWELIANADRAGAAIWVRRLFTDPIDDTIVHIDTKRRRFDGALARLIRHRDKYCRQSYCDAPIRHLDHVQPHCEGGPTSAGNAAGLCEQCNYAKQAPGWTHTSCDATNPTDGTNPEDDTAGEQRTQRIEVRTPTGHRYTNTPPPALGPGGNYRQRRRRARAPSTRPPQTRPPGATRPPSPPRRN